MHIPDDDRPLFENLEEQRRRIYDDFSLLVQRMREGSVRETERIRLEAQQLHAKHENLIQRMVDLLVW